MEEDKPQGEQERPIQRQYFTFYESFFQAIDKLPDDVQLPVYRGVAEYALYRREPDLKGIGDIVWILLKPVLDKSWVNFEKGTKGGAPKGNKNAKKNPQEDIKQSFQQREELFYDSIMKYRQEGWSADLLENFYLYWSESNEDRTLMRFEKEEYWDLERRLDKWAIKEDAFHPR